MEDQQPEPGDLTDSAPDGDEPARGAALGDTDDTEHLPTTSATDSETGEDAAEPARPTQGRWVAVTLAVAAAVFVGAAGFAGAMMQPYLADRALVATKLDIARAATQTITTLWTYTPETIDTLPDRAATYLSGEFATEYRKAVAGMSPANKQAQISLNTEVAGVAVASVEGTHATALVYTNTTSTSPKTKDIPALQFRSHMVSMVRDHGRWRATELAAITNFSLTPNF